ncbi:hypothetical protein PMIN04_009966 [Paraphaeosphaeria minitans]
MPSTASVFHGIRVNNARKQCNKNAQPSFIRLTSRKYTTPTAAKHFPGPSPVHAFCSFPAGSPPLALAEPPTTAPPNPSDALKSLGLWELLPVHNTITIFVFFFVFFSLSLSLASTAYIQVTLLLLNHEAKS